MDYKEKLISLLNSKDLSEEQKTKLEEIFPELAESEDERIRKALIRVIKRYAEGYENVEAGLSVSDAIAWLEKQGEKQYSEIYIADVFEKVGLAKIVRELKNDTLTNALQDAMIEIGKQGEQKPADKVKPKFKVGDFIINDYCMGRIIEITNDAYLLDTEQGIPFSSHSTRLWDITKDANDGDVLKEDSCTFIIERMKTDGTAITHCCLFDDGDFDLGSTLSFDADSTYPATKEQRELLFQKMHEAGYEWDSENKKLKKEEVDNLHNYLHSEQKSAWSEEDKDIIEWLIGYLEYQISNATISEEKNNCLDAISFLKSIKPGQLPLPEGRGLTLH